ncbi:hypothetical protein PCC6912_64890 [Chlorogloeopsis fritschii PCC 6912]|uniref:Uncharacterized protein n=1 Tax=Chlorogloeopsis fritschii PCC 6912 TaxID=211165 RepID=A0A433MW17_CHLFR|nr:hypothetical protein PCC6912_64890 [Chlorogloeopsis fritschii PCC 6912]
MRKALRDINYPVFRKNSDVVASMVNKELEKLFEKSKPKSATNYRYFSGQ